MINLGLISKSSQRLMHNLAHLLLSFQKRSRVQGASRACVEPLRFDELREERVHGSVAELLQICELQTFCRDRVLSVQVRRKEMKNKKKKKKNSINPRHIQWWKNFFRSLFSEREFFQRILESMSVCSRINQS